MHSRKLKLSPTVLIVTVAVIFNLSQGNLAAPRLDFRSDQVQDDDYSPFTEPDPDFSLSDFSGNNEEPPNEAVPYESVVARGSLDYNYPTIDGSNLHLTAHEFTRNLNPKMRENLGKFHKKMMQTKLSLKPLSRDY